MQTVCSLHSSPNASNCLAGELPAFFLAMSQGRPSDCKPSVNTAPRSCCVAPALASSTLTLPSSDEEFSCIPAELPWLGSASWDDTFGCFDGINITATQLQRACDGSAKPGRIMLNNAETLGISTTETQCDIGHEKENYINMSLNCVCADQQHEKAQMINGIRVPIFHVNQENKFVKRNKAIRTHERTIIFKHLSQTQADPLTEKGIIDWNVQDIEDFLSTNDLILIEDYVSIMLVCRKRKDNKLSRQVHKKICSMGLESHFEFGNYIVPMFVDCGIISIAQQVFNKLAHMNECSWTSLISGYIQSGNPLYAFDIYQQMQDAVVHPSSYTLVTLLNMCAELSDIEKGWKVHADVVQEEFERNLFVGNALIDMYGKCGSLIEAREVFDNMSDRDIVSWNALIAGYAEHGLSHEAFLCLGNLQAEGLSPDPTTVVSILKACSNVEHVDKGQILHTDITHKGFFGELLLETALIDMYAKAGLVSEAQEIFDRLQVRDIVAWTALIAGYADLQPGDKAIECFERMCADNISPNIVSYACVLKACGNDKSTTCKGQEVHIEVVKKGYDGDVLAGNSLVGMYAKLGSLDEAEGAFDQLRTRDVVTWNSLISGYAEHGPYQKAFFSFAQMQMENVLPNSVSYASILKACGSFGAIAKGQEIHMDIIGKGLEGIESVGNSLISMYCNFSLLPEAGKVFEKLAGQDVVTWTAIMKGYAMNHDGKLAVDCFEDMQENGLKADVVTLTCLLTACSHAGMVVEGYEYLKAMREKYGMAPRREHYSCMIDLFGRSGRLYEAEKVLEMLCPPSDGTWAALLSACKTYGEIELGLRCFRELLKLDPDNATWYILMKDMYASAGRWGDAMMIEKMRKQTGVAKKPASVLIEVNKKVHEFVVGDKPNEELSAKLRSLNLCLKDEGHLPNVDVVVKSVSDGEKETAICEHAERLAIAFGLLHTPQGQTLRLTKNLRMCNDCHSAGKMISRVEKREIILRDDSCIHHFKDGLCLCKDMY